MSDAEAPIRTNPFEVGSWLVEPSLNRIVSGADVVVLQPKVMKLLLVLAESPGVAIDREALIATLWPGRIVTDSSLYQAVASLRKALGDTEAERRYVGSVSSRGYRLIAPVRAVEKPGKKTSAKSLRPARTALAVGLLAAAALIVIAITMMDRGTTEVSDNDPRAVTGEVTGSDLGNAVDARIESIVLMPWAEEGGDQSRYALAGSLYDAVLSRLARIGDLMVVAGGPGVSEKLRSYDALLRGRVQHQNGQVRVFINLTRSGDGTVLWAAQHESAVGDLFTLQDAVVDSVLRQLEREPVSDLFTADTIDPNVFSDYLLGRVLWAERRPESLDRAEQVFESVIDRAPEFAPAYAGLCDTHFFASVYRDWTLAQALEACSPLLEQALLLDPDLGEALATKALFLSEQGEYDIARKLLERSIAAAPNYAFARMWYGNLLRRQGELTRAEQQQEIAIQLAPVSPIIRRNLAYVLLNQGRVVEARTQYRQSLDLEPEYNRRPIEELEFFDLNVERARAFLGWVAENPHAYRRNPDLALTMAHVRLSLAQSDEARELIEFATDQTETNPSFLFYVRAIFAIVEGDHGAALEWFRRRVELGSNELHFALPYIAALQRNQQFDDALGLARRYLRDLDDGQTVVNEQNHYQLMSFVGLLAHDGQADRAAFLAGMIDEFLATDLDLTDLNHLEWVAGRGQGELAANAAIELIKAGWLPSYNQEPYSAERMRRLVGVDRQEFEQLLAPSRAAVLADD